MRSGEDRSGKRLLGLDYGDKTVGVAVSDGLGLTAQGVEIIRRKRVDKLRQTYARLEVLSVEYGACGIVLGLPLLPDGREGERSDGTRAFGEGLIRRIGLPVVYWNESFSTHEAYELMRQTRVPVDKRDDYVDEIAAMIILQDYLDNHGTDCIFG